MKINLPNKKSLTISVGKESTKKVRQKLLGSFLNLGDRKLSNERSASDKLIDAYASWVYINSSILAEKVSEIELKLYQTNYKGGELVLTELETHPILDLLDRFNGSMTAGEGFYLTESHLNLTGDSFWYIQGGNKPQNIFPLRPDKVTLNLGDFNSPSDALVNSYLYKDVIDGKVKEVTYNPEEIIHFKVPNPANMFRGKSTVEAIANDIDIDTYSGKTLRSFFENGMIIDFVLTTPQRLDNDQITNFQSQLRSAYGGARNAWKVPVFSGDLKPQQLQMSNRDSQLIENLKWYRDKIMIAFHNTPASIGIIEDVNRANSESTLNNWKQSTIKPKMKRIVDQLNEFLVPKYGDNLILGFENPVPEDDTQDTADAVSLYSGGIITQNEAREKLGLDAVPNGDEFKQTGGFNLPQPIKNVDYKKHFRKMGVYKKLDSHKTKYAVVLKASREILAKKKDEPATRPKYSFDYDKVDKYAEIQLKIVDHHEQIFQNALTQLINGVVEEALSNVDNPEARKKHTLVDKDKWKQESINKLDPILTQVLIQAGNQANRLISVDQPYIPKSIKTIDTKAFIKEQILKFMGSAIDTDVDLMTEIISDGLVAEASVSQIRQAIIDKFGDYTQSQATKITRTEVIKASNLGSQDAWEQSGIVEAKQWLATEDDRTDAECSELDGKIVGLEDNYFNQGDKFMGLSLDYEDIEYPPLHPNCRCVILPVLVGEKGFKNSPILVEKLKNQTEQVKELESKLDKRTKAFRDLKAQKLEDDAYIKALEALVDE